jgi:hypothetical protein
LPPRQCPDRQQGPAGPGELMELRTQSREFRKTGSLRSQDIAPAGRREQPGHPVNVSMATSRLLPPRERRRGQSPNSLAHQAIPPPRYLGQREARGTTPASATYLEGKGGVKMDWGGGVGCGGRVGGNSGAPA